MAYTTVSQRRHEQNGKGLIARVFTADGLNVYGFDYDGWTEAGFTGTPKGTVAGAESECDQQIRKSGHICTDACGQWVRIADRVAS